MTKRISTERRAEIYAEKVAASFGIGSPEDKRELYLHFLEACRAEAADEREACARVCQENDARCPNRLECHRIDAHAIRQCGKEQP